MKISNKRWLAGCLLLLCGCSVEYNKKISNDDIEKWKEELRALEKTHMDTAAKYGFVKSILFFAGDEFALIQRNEEPILTLDSIKAAVSKLPDEIYAPDHYLTWKPDFIDVSPSGDMGYTYGYYQIVFQDTTQNPIHGSYLTIWKKNQQGEWKLVAD